MFRVVPLACLLTAAIISLLMGHAWTTRMAAVPWLVALVAVGLPHGAADLAVSRRLCGGQATLRLFAGYAALMAAVLLAFLLVPRPVVVLFAALSLWHFGIAHARGELPPPMAWPGLVVAAVARGASVLGVPLAAWPEATGEVVAELLELFRLGGGTPPFAAESIRITGMVLVGTGLVAWAAEAVARHRSAGGTRRSAATLVDLAVIGLLGIVADPLFSIGLYFLCWHAWREMRPLIGLLAARTDSRPPALRSLVLGLATVHAAAVPLLIPTWAALAAGWWILSPDHSARDLALVSLVMYLVVTPAHEALLELLATDGRPIGRCVAVRHEV